MRRISSNGFCHTTAMILLMRASDSLPPIAGILRAYAILNSSPSERARPLKGCVCGSALCVHTNSGCLIDWQRSSNRPVSNRPVSCLRSIDTRAQRTKTWLERSAVTPFANGTDGVRLGRTQPLADREGPRHGGECGKEKEWCGKLTRRQYI